MKNKRKLLRINRKSSYFFEKINRINKHLAKLIKRKREKIQFNKIRGEITADTTEKKSILREYLENWPYNKLEIQEFDIFLCKYDI
jgi:hypothetical protein